MAESLRSKRLEGSPSQTGMNTNLTVQYMGLDVSLSMIPPNHPLLDPRLLEAEGAGLLDKMLTVLQENSRYV